MKPKLLFLVLFALCLPIVAHPAPARKGAVMLRQPDGTPFRAFCSGDEYSNVLTTEDGLLISRTGAGEYRYAYFDSEGTLCGFDVPVGGYVPSYVRLKSSIIPYSTLSARSSNLRRAAPSPGVFREKFTRSAADVSVRSIVLLVQFADMKFTFQKSDFEDMISMRGYSAYGADGSVVDYLFDQFGGKVSFEFDVAPVVTLSRNMSFYASDSESRTDVNAAEAVIEACRLSDDAVDFSQYDNDGDGVVENLIVIVAGWRQNEGAGEDFIWPHCWSIVKGENRNVILDGVAIDNYAISTELSYDSSEEMPDFTSIGVFCHEFGHLLGLKDMYDTDNELNGQSKGLWNTTSIMDFGCGNNDGRTPPNFNSIERNMLGVGSALPVKTGEMSLKPIDTAGEFIRMDTDTDGEYFLMENRIARGWDRFIGGSGLLVYHVDRSANDAGGMTAAERWEKNSVNSNSYFECAHLIPAVRDGQSEFGDSQGIFFGEGTCRSLFWRTHPDYSFKNGKEPLFSLSDIVQKGDDLRLTVTGPVSIDVLDVFQDAVILNWSTDVDSYMDQPTTLSWKDERGVNEVDVMPYVPGHYAFTASSLSPKTDYTFTISYASGSTDYKSVELTVTTKAFYFGSLPFIFLNGAARTVDQCFQKGTRIPLRIFNCPAGCIVKWYFDRAEIDVDRTGYYALERNGMLEARIEYPDGTDEIILKQIVVK